MGNGIPSDVPVSVQTRSETSQNGNDDGRIYSMNYILSKYIIRTYNALRILATVAMMSVLVYIGIRIVISSVSEKAKYKQMLGDWLVGMILLYTMHYIMYFSNMAVDTLTGFLNNVNPSIYGEVVEKDKNGYIEKALEENEMFSKGIAVDEGDHIVWYTDLVGTIRMKANSQDGSTAFLGYTILFIAMVIYTAVFIFMYARRLIYLAFLTMIAPLVALTYPIDKVKDGSAQGFNYWFREYIFNLLLQPMHLLIFTLLISAAIEFAAVNFVYALCALGFIANAEKIIRTMFGFQKASTPGAFAGPAGAALAFSGMHKLLGRSPGDRGKGKDSSGKDLNKGKSEDGFKPLKSAGTIESRLGDIGSFGSTSNYDHGSGIGTPGLQSRNNTMNAGRPGMQTGPNGAIIGNVGIQDEDSNNGLRGTNSQNDISNQAVLNTQEGQFDPIPEDGNIAASGEDYAMMSNDIRYQQNQLGDYGDISDREQEYDVYREQGLSANELANDYGLEDEEINDVFGIPNISSSEDNAMMDADIRYEQSQQGDYGEISDRTQEYEALRESGYDANDLIEMGYNDDEVMQILGGNAETSVTPIREIDNSTNFTGATSDSENGTIVNSNDENSTDIRLSGNAQQRSGTGARQSSSGSSVVGNIQSNAEARVIRGRTTGAMSSGIRPATGTPSQYQQSTNNSDSAGSLNSRASARQNNSTLSNMANRIKENAGVEYRVRKQRAADSIERMKHQAKEKIKDGKVAEKVGKTLTGAAIGAAGLIGGVAAGAVTGDASKAFQYGVTGAIAGDKFGQSLSSGAKARVAKVDSRRDQLERERLRVRYGAEEGDKKFKEIQQTRAQQKWAEDPDNIKMLMDKMSWDRKTAKNNAFEFIKGYSDAGIKDPSEMVKLEKFKNKKRYQVIDKENGTRREMTRGEYAQLSRLANHYEIKPEDKNEKINKINERIAERNPNIRSIREANILQNMARDYVEFKQM